MDTEAEKPNESKKSDSEKQNDSKKSGSTRPSSAREKSLSKNSQPGPPEDADAELHSVLTDPHNSDGEGEDADDEAESGLGSPRSSEPKGERKSSVLDIMEPGPAEHKDSGHVRFKSFKYNGNTEDLMRTSSKSLVEVAHDLDDIREHRRATGWPDAPRHSHHHHPNHPHHYHHRPSSDQALAPPGAPSGLMRKYWKPPMIDEGSQAGISSWDWLSRLEQMLIHFFLTIFESKNDDSKLMMELMSTGAGSQVEDIFQLLLKAEPDMYKELGHLITLAENWLIHWKGDSEEREKAMNFVRMYLKNVRSRNYYKLPIQVRLHKLGAFIAGLKDVGKGGEREPIKYPTYRSLPPVNKLRSAMSPRVKPATHFSRVVANILCGRPCDNPLPVTDIYADKLGRLAFKNTLHGDKEFKAYTDVKYGDLFNKRDVFSKTAHFSELPAVDAGGDASHCIDNKTCWLPLYDKRYIDGLNKTGNQCALLAQVNLNRALESNSCHGGINADGKPCKSSKNDKKGNKIYEWVRGPDGKVYQRLVRSYNEVGASSSVDSIFRQQGRSHSPRKGPGPSKQKVTNKPSKFVRGHAPKVVSDSKLHQDRLGQDRRKSKLVSQKDKDFGTLGKAYNQQQLPTKGKVVVALSLDGSGDSGADDPSRSKKKELAKKIQPTVSNRFGKNNNFGGKRVGYQDGKHNSRFQSTTNYVTSHASHHKSHQNNNKKSNNNLRDRGRSGYSQSKTNTWNRNLQSTSHRGVHQRDFYRGDREPNRDFKKGNYSLFNEGQDWAGEGAGYGSWGQGQYRDSEDNAGHNMNMAHLTEEQQNMMIVNQCWEKAAKLLKRPSKGMVIPPAQNLMLYLEHKFPGYKWGKGEPIAVRHFPNGNVFVAQYANGGSRVYYPHGGLAVAISGPSPSTSQILVVRDPSDQIFFFDKALLANLNSSGKGTVYGDDGVISAEYSTIGGFKFDNGMEKGCRWLWNQGGQRLIMKLNKFISIRMSDFDKIYLNFYGNMRGFLVNVATGMEVTVMSLDKPVDPAVMELRNLIRPKTTDDKFDYVKGRFTPRSTLGFVDKQAHWNHYDSDDEDNDGDRRDSNELRNNEWQQEFERLNRSYNDRLAESFSRSARNSYASQTGNYF